VKSILEVLLEAAVGFAAFIQEVQAGAPVPGVEELLLTKGYEPIHARLAARLIVALGAQWARDRVEIEKPLAGVLRGLSKKTQGKSHTLMRNAKRLQTWLDRDDAKAFVATWLEEAGLPLTVEDVRQIAALGGNRDETACERLVEIAKALLPHLPDPRGRPVSSGTGVHLLLLFYISTPAYRPSYTWRDVESDFVDPVTRATRVLLNNPNFDPRPACRLSRMPDFSHHFER
jgi:hypothetical protein